jgi:hypothetical protein
VNQESLINLLFYGWKYINDQKQVKESEFVVVGFCDDWGNRREGSDRKGN